MREATRQLPSHLLSALSGKCISTSPSPVDGKDPLLSDIDIEDADCVALEIAEGTATDLQWPVKLNEAGMAEEIPEAQAPRPAVPAPLFSQPALFSGDATRASSSEIGRQKQEASVQKKRQPRGLKGLTNLGVSVEPVVSEQCAELIYSLRLEHVFHEQRFAVLV